MSSICPLDDPSQLEEWEVYFKERLEVFHSIVHSVHTFVFIPLCVAGVLANALIVGVLLRPSMRCNPFNHFLVAIAFCDGTLMAAYLIYENVNSDRCHPWYSSYAWIVFTKLFAILSVVLHSASLWLTVNMAVLRFVVLSQGSSSTRSRLPPANTPRAASFSIGVALVIAILGSLLNSVRYEIVDGGAMHIDAYSPQCINSSHGWHSGDTVHIYGMKQPQWWTCRLERLNFWINAVTCKLIPCVLLTVFMALLVNMLVEARKRRERLCGPTAANTQAERTTAMLTVIVAVFLVTEMPQGLVGLATGARPELSPVRYYTHHLFNLLSLINSATNFLLCALMSAVFRRECVQLFSSCCPRVSSSESATAATRLLTLPPSKNGFMPVPTSAPAASSQS